MHSAEARRAKWHVIVESRALLSAGRHLRRRCRSRHGGILLVLALPLRLSLPTVGPLTSHHEPLGLVPLVGRQVGAYARPCVRVRTMMDTPYARLGDAPPSEAAGSAHGSQAGDHYGESSLLATLPSMTAQRTTSAGLYGHHAAGPTTTSYGGGSPLLPYPDLRAVPGRPMLRHKKGR